MFGEEELRCPACKNLYSNGNPPRLLSDCGHSFCDACARKQLLEQHEGLLRCPLDGSAQPELACPRNDALLSAIHTPTESAELSKPVIPATLIRKDQSFGRLSNMHNI